MALELSRSLLCHVSHLIENIELSARVRLVRRAVGSNSCVIKTPGSRVLRRRIIVILLPEEITASPTFTTVIPFDAI